MVEEIFLDLAKNQSGNYLSHKKNSKSFCLILFIFKQNKNNRLGGVVIAFAVKKP